MKLFKGITLKNVIFTILLLTATTLFADSYWDLKKSAMGAYKGGNSSKAITLAKAFIDKNPKNYKAQNLLAVFYFWNHDYKEAETILNNILAKTDYKESKSLLSRVHNKMAKRKNSTHKSTYKTVKKANTKSQTTDLEYLVAKVEDNPQDIQNRVLLSKFYFKIEEFQKAYDLAHEVLMIDPNNKKMKAITKHLENQYRISYSAAVEGSAIDKDKAKMLLKKLHNEKKYSAFMNLYEALKNAHVTFTKEEYVDILHASIMLEKYKKAENLLAKGLVPVSKDSLKVQMLLSKKLARSVASK